jgi:DNA-binding winged helix-turn-helix (wHTH) protein/TolB-like protein/tetratricopeptide (TPR) repeat protein
MSTSPDISFDGWTLRGLPGELEKDGRRLRLQDQPLQILQALLEKPGAVVTREELIARLWPKGIVDFETSLNTAVRKLRVALGDEADTPRYIETLPRKGYRFIGTVTMPSTTAGDSAPRRAPGLSRPRVAAWITIGALLVGAGMLIAPALRRLPTASEASRAPVVNSLAVLPFRPLLPAARNPALEFGMADTLITQLSNLPGVRISPLSAVRTYDAANQDPLAAGRSLLVAAVLDGSIQTDQKRVRVSARLLRVSDGSALWSSQFDEPVSDIFSVQDAIARQVVQALAITLSPGAQRRMLRQSTSSADAYQAYVSGLYKWQRRMPQAVQDFEAAIRADPNYALAWSGLSSALTAQGVFGYAPPDKVFPRAKDAALKARALDAELGDADAALGHVLIQYERRYAEGEKLYLAAIQRNPDDAPSWHGLGIVRACLGRKEQGLADMQHAQELEPTTLAIRANVGLLLYLNREYDKAMAQVGRVIELDPDYSYAHSLMGRVLLAKGDIDGALKQFAARTQPNPGSDGDLGRAYARAGRVNEARAELARLKKRAQEGFGVAYDVATIHAALGETAKACAALEQSLSDHSQLVGFLELDPAIDALRSAPCYQKVRAELMR